MLPRAAAVKSRCSRFKYGRSMSVTCTGICIALRVVLAISWLSILVAASDAEDALRQPELIAFRSGDLDLKGLFGNRRGPVHFRRFYGITAARSAQGPLIPLRRFL